MREAARTIWSAHLAGALRGAGVRRAVLSPGSRSTPLALALADRGDLDLHVVLDERSAAFFALGLARAERIPVVLLCTSGSAGAHYLPALIEASASGVPLVAITADRPWELHGFGAPQTMAQADLYGRFVRRSEELPPPDDSPKALAHLAAVVARAVHAAKTGFGGPVHLNVPFRKPLEPERPGPGPVVDPLVPRFSPPPTEPDLRGATPLIAAARRGVIVCGPRDRDDGFGEAVHALGLHLGLPVLAEAASNARYGFPEAICGYDAILRDDELARRLAPDLVLRFGGGATPRSLIELKAPSTVIFSEGPIIDPHHAATLVVSGDPLSACRGLIRGTPPGGQAWRVAWSTAEAATRRVLDGESPSGEPGVARSVVASLPPGASLVVSSSMPIRDVDAFAPAGQGPLRVFSNRGVNGIDGVTSTALGIATATGGPTVLLTGDLALLHDLGAWIAARSLRPRLVVVVVHNDGGGIFHFLPVADKTEHFERLFATPHGVDLAHVAALAGARHRVLRLEDLPGELASACREGLHLLEIRTDRAANVSVHARLYAAMAGAAR